MKKLVLTAFIAILSIAICLLSMFHVSSIAAKANEYVENIQTSINSQQYRKALIQVNELSNFWKQNHSTLSMVLHHEMLEEIEESIALVKSSLEHPDKENINFWNQITSSLVKLKNLKDTESPSLSNIL